MINLPPLHSAKRVEVKAIPEILKTWQVGQILQSRARTSSNAQGELQIQIGKHILDANTQSPIKEGANFQLQVARLGIEPLLKILTQTPASSVEPTTLLLRQFVPQPGAIKNLLNIVNLQIGQLTKLNTDKLPELKPVIEQLQRLLQAPVRPDNQLAPNIKEYVTKTGINLENQLSQNKLPLPPQNLKLNLLQLNKQLHTVTENLHTAISTSKTPDQVATQLVQTGRLAELSLLLLNHLTTTEKTSFIQSFTSLSTSSLSLSLPARYSLLLPALQQLPVKQLQQLQLWLQQLPVLSEIRQLTEQSLSTLTNQQLQSANADSNSAFMLLFNLLVAKTPDWIDLFNIKFYQEENKQEEQDHWKITIQTDLTDLGRIEAQLIFSNQELHTSVTAESQLTHTLINENLDLLKQGLNSVGFNVATISSQHHSVKPLESSNVIHGPLLDDKV